MGRTSLRSLPNLLNRDAETCEVGNAFIQILLLPLKVHNNLASRIRNPGLSDVGYQVVLPRHRVDHRLLDEVGGIRER